jgi:hypothetical protein
MILIWQTLLFHTPTQYYFVKYQYDLYFEKLKNGYQKKDYLFCIAF